MRKAFSKIDLFGKAVLFNYQGHSKSKSKFGALLTIALVCFVIWLVVYFGQAIYQKKNPKAYTYQSFSDDPPETPLDIDTFPFGFGLEDPITFEYYLNESLYTIQAFCYQTIRTPLPNNTITIAYEYIPLVVEPCRSDHFGDLADKFSYLALNQMYCLAKEQPSLNGGKPTMRGTYESPIHQSVAFRVFACDNATSQVTCGTQEEINKKLDGGYFGFAYQNLAIDLTNNEQPATKFRDAFYTTIGSTSSKDVTANLQLLEINSDSGWFTTSYATENYLKIDTVQDLLSLVKKKYIVTLDIRLGTVKNYYSRSYAKVQDVVAQVNGLVTVAFTVLFIVLAPYARLKFYEALINDIFDVKLTVEKPKSKNQKKKNAKHKTKKNAMDNQSKPQLKTQEEYYKTQEQHKLTYKQTDFGLSDISDRKGRDDHNLLKNITSFAEPSVKTPQIERFDSLGEFREKSSFRSGDIGLSEIKDHPGFSPDRIQQHVLVVSPKPQSEDNKPEININIEQTSEIGSPLSERGRSLLSARKPEFLQAHFKVLDYDISERDLFEDMLKNVAEHQVRDRKGGHKVSSEAKEYQKVEQPSDTVVNNNEEEEEKEKDKEEKRIVDKIDRAKSLQRLQSIISKHSEEIDLSFLEYIRSFFTRSKVIKEKMSILNEGIKRIDERLDIFNLFKKLREFDKLKVLLLENEQFVLFDSLPRPELVLLDKNKSQNQKEQSKSKLKDAQFVQDKIKQDLILLSYENLKHKATPTVLDKKILEIYNDILL